MAVLLALGAALAYGLSDFVGGLISRRTSAWAVAVVGSAAGAVVTAALLLVVGGSPRAVDLAWATAAGFGAGAGIAFLYRGLATGRMAVVAPVSAVGAALVPVLAGLVGGERPSWLVWTGIALAAPAIWLVSSNPADRDGQEVGPSGLGDAVRAGLGFGLLFACLGQVPDDSGLAPLALTQVVSILAVAGLAVLLRVDWVPRDRAVLGALVSGPLGALGNLLFLFAAQRGLLAVSGVLTSLYPALTVLLAAVVLRERIHRVQGAGLALCAVTVVLVAAG